VKVLRPDHRRAEQEPQPIQPEEALNDLHVSGGIHGSAAAHRQRARHRGGRVHGARSEGRRKPLSISKAALQDEDDKEIRKLLMREYVRKMTSLEARGQHWSCVSFVVVALSSGP